jgi:hypothetical protein
MHQPKWLVEALDMKAQEDANYKRLKERKK